MLAIACAPGADSHWTQRTEIAGREYLLTFRFNARVGHWVLSVADQDGGPLASGLVLVSGVPLLLGQTDPRLPTGALYVIDALNQDDVEAGFADLGSRFRLVYLTAAEVAEIVA